MRTFARAMLIASIAASGATAASPAAAEEASRPAAEMGERVFQKVTFVPGFMQPVATIARQPAGRARTVAEEALMQKLREMARTGSVQHYCGMPVMRADPALDAAMVKKLPSEVVERTAKRIIQPTVCAKPDETADAAKKDVQPTRP